jgi:acyl carrier protein
VRSKIRTFLSRPFKGHDFQDDDDIFGLGFVDSLFAMELVLFIEQEFQVRIESEDLDLDNFRTVDAMVKMVDAKITPKTN